MGASKDAWVDGTSKPQHTMGPFPTWLKPDASIITSSRPFRLIQCKAAFFLTLP